MHGQGRPYFLKRTLVLEQHSSPRSQKLHKCEFHYIPSTKSIDFGSSIGQLLQQQPQLHQLLHNAQLFLKDPQTSMRTFLGQHPLKPETTCQYDLAHNEVTLTLRHPNQQPRPPQPPATKNRRERAQRTIGQVRESLWEWRQQQRQRGCSGRRAAGLVGLSKKTLDDYTRTIRQAESLNFDFEAYQNHRMGALRAFLREKAHSEPEECKENDIDIYWDSTFIGRQDSSREQEQQEEAKESKEQQSSEEQGQELSNETLKASEEDDCWSGCDINMWGMDSLHMFDLQAVYSTD